MRPRRPVVFVLLCSILQACRDVATPPIERRAESPRFAISDGAHGGSARLYFLPPLIIPPPAFSGTFDATVFGNGSNDEVYVCQIAGLTCATIVSFGPADVRMDPIAETYTVIWQTRSANLIPDVFYRIVVKVRGETLGYADVVVLPNGAGRQAINSEYFVAILAGTTVPIQFRLQVGAPTPVPSSRSTITAGGQYVLCGLAGAAAYCWGNNLWGQLGDGTFGGIKPPGAVTGNLGFASITSGPEYSCGLNTAGAAYCWGRNQFGELGSAETPAGPFARFAAPVAVSGSLTFAVISAGGVHTCGLTLDGDAYCWGYNDFGQLGDGTNTHSSTPVAVAGGHRFTSISAGGFHTCAVGVDHTTHCWGQSDRGQAGAGGDANFPQGRAGPAFTSISAGAQHTCGLSGGQVFCWGDNSQGQLGNGTSVVETSTPMAVPAGFLFTAVSAGGSHSCGLAAGGAAYCWGRDNNGALGDANYSGPNFASIKPTPQPVSGGLTYSEISAGSDHTCARTSGNAVYCWGANVEYFNGQLGRTFEPVLVVLP